MSDEPDNNHLLNFIAATVEAMRDQMATKDDVAQLEGRIDRMELQMSTRSDIARLEAEIAATRGDIERVHLRLDTIERALTSRLNQIESELSRLRSVVYLLVKDRPELLRLLGQEPPPS
jgi:predicted  nucleic acid-binding Zn-ribbon protein